MSTDVGMNTSAAMWQQLLDQLVEEDVLLHEAVSLAIRALANGQARVLAEIVAVAE